MSITMHEGLIDQDQKFKKRIASRDTSTYKVVHRRKLVVGFPIDEGVLGFQNKYDAAAVSPAYDIWEETGSHQIDLNYFERILRSPFARMIYASKMRGTTNRRRTVPKEIFKQIMFPLPPLEEQKRIAEILDAADALRAKRREALAKLDDLLQSTFLDMFGDPVTNPKGWEVGTIGDHTSVGSGAGFPNKYQGEASGDYPFYKVSDMNLPENERQMQTHNNAISDEVRVALRAKSHPIGTIIFPKIGAAIATNKKRVLTTPSCFDNNVIGIHPTNRISVSYLFELIQTKDLMDFANPGNPPSIRKTAIEDWSIPLPPLDLQQRFAEIVSSVEEQKAKMRKHLEQLDDLFASLQQRAFRGDL